MNLLLMTGGLSSAAALCLLARAELTTDLVLVATAYSTIEHPDTLAYIQHVILPFLRFHAIPHQRVVLGGAVPSSFPTTIIPSHNSNGSARSHSCVDRKRDILLRFICKISNAPVLSVLTTSDGFVLPSSAFPFPVLTPFSRFCSFDLQKIVEDFPLPLPYRSRCWFCGYQTMTEWRTLRRSFPQQWKDVTTLEKEMVKHGQFLTPARSPLSTHTHPLYANVSPPQSGLCFL